MKKKIGIVIILSMVIVLTIFSGVNAGDILQLANTEIFLPLVLHDETPEPEPQIDMIGPDGGYAEGIVFAPSNSDVLYINAYGDGVYRSADGGSTWVRRSNGLPNLFSESIAVDLHNENVVYLGVRGFGVWKTLDGGVTWFDSSTGMTDQPVLYEIEIDPNNNQVIYACGRGLQVFPDGSGAYHPPYFGGVWKSTNAGASWSKINWAGSEGWVYSLAIDPTNTQIIYAASHETGVFKSVDGGATWVSKLGIMINSPKARDIEIDPLRPNTVYVSTWSSGAVYKSDYGGDNWQMMAGGTSGLSLEQKVYDLETDIRPDGYHTEVFISTPNNGIYYSSNYAENWVHKAFAGMYIAQTITHPENRNIMFTLTKDRSIWKSADNGSTWVRSDTGFKGSIIASVANDYSNPNIIYTSTYGDGLWKSIDNGLTWFTINNGLPTPYIHTIVIHPTNPSILFAGTSYAGLFKSTNAGTSWSAVNSPAFEMGSSEFRSSSRIRSCYELPGTTLGPEFDREDLFMSENEIDNMITAGLNGISVFSIAFDMSNLNVVVVGTSSGLRFSLDGATTWRTTSIGGGNMYEVAVDSVANPKTAYSTESSVYSFRKSTWDGYVFFWWYYYDAGIPDLISYSVDIEMPGTQTLYLGTDNGVYKTINAGNNWSLAGLSNLRIKDFFRNPLDQTQLFSVAQYTGTPVSPEGGLFYTLDGGATWQTYEFEWNNHVMNTGAVGYGDNLFFIGLQGGNIYRVNR